MSPGLAGLLALASFLVAARGVLLLRQPGVAERQLERLAEVAPDPGARAAARGWRAAGERLGPMLETRIVGARRERVEARIARAGRPGGITVEAYAARKVTEGLAGATMGLALVAVGGSPLVVAGTALAGFFWADLRLDRAGRLRQRRIERDLPDFLDILAVTVSAGLGYRAALARVAAALGGPIGEEVRTTLQQLELGATRRQAFEALRERNDSEALARFVAAELQAEELGVPLAEAIAGIAAEMRRETYQRARQRAQRAAPRVSLIVTATIAPASLILIIAGLVLGSGFELGGQGGTGGP